ncbi:MAG: hypothetical protein ACK4PI_02235 [Tepidisphaerales bacterium]
MRKLLQVILVLAAVHFLAIMAGAGYLLATGKLNRETASAIRDVLFPPPPAPAAEPPPTTQPAPPPTPLLRLEELLARQAGRPATEQVETIRGAFDEQMSLLERRFRELQDLQRQVELARGALAVERAALEERERSLAERETRRAEQEQDQGFQTELQLLTAMPAAQAKRVLMAMDEETAARYVQAMPARAATKILREFKTGEENAHLQAVLARIRAGGGTVPGETGRTAGAAP